MSLSQNPAFAQGFVHRSLYQNLTIDPFSGSGGISGIRISSREIAKWCEKNHSHVCRDTRKMFEELNLDESKFGSVYLDAKNEQRTEYLLSEDLVMTLITGYRIDIRHRVIKELESYRMGTGSNLSVPDFSNPAAAARAWADEYEARLLAQATKAEIGTRREATAMNTASQAVKKANKLELEFDRSQQYVSVKRMSLLYHGQDFSWRELKHVSKEMDFPAIDVFDANYGTVKAYHADVWLETYALEIFQ